VRRRLWLLFFVAALLCPMSVGAQGNQPPSDSAAIRERAVIACVREVRAKHPGSHFDAHIGLRGDVRLSGSPAEQAEFRECMQRLGQPMEDDSVRPR